MPVRQCTNHHKARAGERVCRKCGAAVVVRRAQTGPLIGVLIMAALGLALTGAIVKSDSTTGTPAATWTLWFLAVVALVVAAVMGVVQMIALGVRTGVSGSTRAGSLPTTAQAPNTISQPPAAGQRVEDLRKLAELRSYGVIDEVEFQRLKNDIFDSEELDAVTR